MAINVASEDEQYQSTTELEWSMQPANDSDVEIVRYGDDGTILSGISEYDDEVIDDDMINFGNYQYFDEDPATNYRHSLLDNLHSAHLYIQKRQSSTIPFVNSLLYFDEYYSFKYFYERTLSLSMEIMLLFGVFIFHFVSTLFIILITCIIFKDIQLMIFQFIACITSNVFIHTLCYVKVLPFRSMPNVINPHMEDPYGFNLKRSINLRYLWYKGNDKNVSSFPCFTVVNVAIYSFSCYLYSDQALVLLLVPYVIISRSYFAFNHILDCIFSLAFGLCMVGIAMYLIPQSFLIIADEIITEIPLNIFS